MGEGSERVEDIWSFILIICQLFLQYDRTTFARLSIQLLPYYPIVLFSQKLCLQVHWEVHLTAVTWNLLCSFRILDQQTAVQCLKVLTTHVLRTESQWKMFWHIRSITSHHLLGYASKNDWWYSQNYNISEILSVCFMPFTLLLSSLSFFLKHSVSFNSYPKQYSVFYILISFSSPTLFPSLPHHI